MTTVIPEVRLILPKAGSEKTIPLKDAIGKKLNQSVLIEVPEGITGSGKGLPT